MWYRNSGQYLTALELLLYNQVYCLVEASEVQASISGSRSP